MNVNWIAIGCVALASLVVGHKIGHNQGLADSVPMAEAKRASDERFSEFLSEMQKPEFKDLALCQRMIDYAVDELKALEAVEAAVN